MREFSIMAAEALIWLLITPQLKGAENAVRGKVTYVAAGVVYASLGREDGLRDSTLLAVVSLKDTIATVRVFALSSHSSSCTLVRSSRAVRTGDDVIGTVPSAAAGALTGAPADGGAKVSGGPAGAGDAGGAPSLGSTGPVPGSVLDLHGRISTQYIATRYDNSGFNISQPGVVISLRGAMRDLPLKLEMFANIRTLSYGGASPFARSAVNQSRIYGLSLSYDDGRTVASLGRIIPISAPSIGYIDGALVSRRFGDLVIGTVAGYQPEWTMRGISTDYRKVAFFAEYSPSDRRRLSLSAAYSRTYYHTMTDREAASLLVNGALTDELYLYGNAEMDLRQKDGDEFILAPRLTSAYTTLYLRVANSLTFGLGVDAARPFYSFESVRAIPDSLLFDDLRAGLNASVSWSLPWGIGLHETYAPRASRARFGQEYSNTSSLTIADVFSSGLSLRGNFNTSSSEYADMTGYGVAAQAGIARIVDLTLRVQQNGYLVQQTRQQLRSTIVGGDVMVFLTRALTLVLSYDRRNEYGMTSHAIFAECGVRF